MVSLPDPGAPMMRVLALLPLERDLNSQYLIISEEITTTTTYLLSDTVTRDLVDTLVKRLDNKVLENMVWNIESY